MARRSTDHQQRVFYPDLATNVVQGRHLHDHWNGARVDFYRDAGSGEAFRVS